MADRAKTCSVSFHCLLKSKKDLADYVAKEIPLWELTCPFPKQFWRGVSELPKVGYVNSLEGISSLLVMTTTFQTSGLVGVPEEQTSRRTPPGIWCFKGVCRQSKNTKPASFGGTGCVGREIPPFLAMIIASLEKVVYIYHIVHKVKQPVVVDGCSNKF